MVPAGIVEGVVLDEEGRPAAGKPVHAGGRGDHDIWTRTDSLGRFRTEAAPGRYECLFLEADEGPIVVRARETTRVTLRPSDPKNRR